MIVCFSTLAEVKKTWEHTNVANVVIVGGTREVHNETTTLDEINDGFIRMIDTAKTAANTVYVCSVRPTSANKNDERRERANEMIRATCEVKNAKFINNDLNFTYRDGSCDEAAFVKDGIHLSTHGLSKLLSNISLSERQQTPTARPGKNRPPNRQGSPPKRTTRDTRGNVPHAAGLLQARHVGQRAATMAEPAWHIVGQCRKCGETNHVTKKCRHDVAVTCFTCGQKGHKNTHHQPRR